jgi:hypothetical protein
MAADEGVVLERGPLVRVVADGLAGLAPGRAVVVRVDQEGLFQPGGVSLDSRGEAQLHLTPGEHTLYVCVVGEGASEPSPFDMLAAAERAITVEDRIDGEQVFRLELSTEELEGRPESPDQGWVSPEEFSRSYGDGDQLRR